MGATNTDPLSPGRQVGKYEVVRRLASGGMAEIYLARARGIEGFEKYVVLKRILPQYARSEAFVRMFLNEARLAATLDHPNIATVYDIDQYEGVYFFTMEYLHGEDLGFILHDLGERSLALPLEHALSVAIGVAAGLHAAHEKRGQDGNFLGIVHRDVSPQNVVVSFAGGVKLVDFGIAKVTSHPDFTGSGSVKGKFSYMSPEQCRNVPLDRRSDIFSLGILLYEMTTQSRLFKGDTEIATIQAVLDKEVPPPSNRIPGYPQELEAVVLKALERRPDERWSTGRELQLALEAFASARGLAISSAGLGEWMERTFGPKIEPWREMFEERDPAQAAIATVAMGSPGDAGASGNATRVSTPPSVPRVRSRPRAWGIRGLVLAAAVAALAGGAGALWQSRQGAGGAGAAEVVLVSEKGEVSLDPAPGPAPSPPAPVVPTAAAAPPPAHPRRARRERPDRNESVTEKFSVAFGRKQRELERCFTEHPDDAARAGQMFVRFHAAADGKVASADVLPAEVARTALGACVAKVALTTQFGPQSAPVAFRIPVMVRRVGTKSKP